MKTTLEKQLKDKCEALNIYLDIEHDRIRIDLPATKIFGTTLTHWEYCVIPTASDLCLSRDQKYSYKKERNESIRLMLEAIETIDELADGEKCGNQDECEECYG